MGLIRRILLLFTCVFYSYCEAQERYHPLRIETDIKLDGRLTEPEWNQIEPLSDFMQSSPFPGANPTEKTEVKLLYNNAYLCVGFHCYDSTANKMIRLLMDRDFELGRDDGISVQLDTYNDKNTSVLFVTNTLSARFDSEISSNGSSMNDDYNNFWDVATVVDSNGYTAEFRIPFSSLRFEQKENTIMGFRLARLIKRKNELITYPRCDSSLQNKWNNVSQAAELEFANLKTKKPIYVTPYIIGNFEQQSKLNNTSSGYEYSSTFFTRKHFVKDETIDKILSNLGADIKYGISKNFTLNLTVNTDFAQAEVDNRIINFTKYAINLPEKRNFFLESKGYLGYQVGQATQLFNSRNIGLEIRTVVPILGGIRITGKYNNWTVGALNMQTAEVKEKNIQAKNFSVARLRKYYDTKGSFWGGIVTNKVTLDNSKAHNQSIGVDLVHFFNDKWLAGFGIATTYDSTVKSAFHDNGFYNIFAFKNAGVGYTHAFDFELAGKNFNPEMGFNPEREFGFVSISNGKKIQFKRNIPLNFWRVNTTLDYRWKTDTKLTETKVARLEFGLDWKKGSTLDLTLIEYKEDRLFEPFTLNEHISAPKGYYKMYSGEGSFTYDISKNYTLGFATQVGDFYGGLRFKAAPDFSYFINRYLRVGANYEFNEIKFPTGFSDNGNSLFKSNLLAANIVVSASSKFSVKLLAQYDDISDSFGGNLRIRYNPKEGTDLFIVYNSLFNTHPLDAKPTLNVLEQQTIVIKFATTFGL